MKQKAAAHIGERVRGLRIENKLSLRILADRCSLSANTLSLIERNVTSPTLTTLIAIARVFHVPVGDLFDCGGKETASLPFCCIQACGEAQWMEGGGDRDIPNLRIIGLHSRQAQGAQVPLHVATGRRAS